MGTSHGFGEGANLRGHACHLDRTHTSFIADIDRTRLSVSLFKLIFLKRKMKIPSAPHGTWGGDIFQLFNLTQPFSAPSLPVGHQESKLLKPNELPTAHSVLNLPDFDALSPFCLLHASPV